MIIAAAQGTKHAQIHQTMLLRLSQSRRDTA